MTVAAVAFIILVIWGIEELGARKKGHDAKSSPSPKQNNELAHV
jgi:hypothetical protein